MTKELKREDRLKLNYLLTIEEPANHMLSVKLVGERSKDQNEVTFFIPSWSPGSYLMREYGRHLSQFKAFDGSGNRLYHEQTAKGTFLVRYDHQELKSDSLGFEIEYQMYCHELTVRTSHIDSRHAFLHLPSLLMGVKDTEMKDPEIEVRFPPVWSKLTTGLKDISEQRQVFRYTAPDYDDLIDCPIEIGNQETDGFQVEGIDHELAFTGRHYFQKENLKKDIKTIVEFVAKTMKDIPYDRYVFMTHFAPNLFGGLEHKNSTALHFCSQKLAERKGYVNWLALVAHEYFHTWNVKRIRPKELGPFDYLNENYTRMHWLTEGLTSFMDEVLVFRAGLCTLEEYLDMLKNHFKRYFATPGRKFHSLEDSSFNTWIKLYRPDESSANTSISYYLKGGIVWWCLHALLFQKGKSINHLLDQLWGSYRARPEIGLTSEEVYAMIEEVGGKDVLAEFRTMIETTQELDIEKYLALAGLSFEYGEAPAAWLGFRPNFEGDRVFVQSVELDSAAYSSGLNAGDEIIAIDGLRVLKTDFESFEKSLVANHPYQCLVSRTGHLETITLVPVVGPRPLVKINVDHPELAVNLLKFEG